MKVQKNINYPPHKIPIFVNLTQLSALMLVFTAVQLFTIQTSFSESLKIDEGRLPETPTSKSSKLENSFKNDRDKQIMNLIHELQSLPPDASTKEGALTSETNTNYYYNNIKKKRTQLKTLLRQALDADNTEPKKLKEYEKILNSHPSTSSLLAKNTEESLQERIEELKEENSKHKQNIKILMEEMDSKLRDLYTKPNWTNTDRKMLFTEFNISESYQKQIVTEQNLALDADEKLKLLEHRKNEAKALGYSFKSPSASPSFVSIDKNQCHEISFDNISKMGPDSDQADTGTCWAHASAAMLEEQLCLAHPEHCGKNISRTQIIGHTQGIDFRPGSTMDGGNPSAVLRYFTHKKGENFEVCLDHFNRNPFDLRERNTGSQGNSFFKKFFRKKNLKIGPGFDYINFLRGEYFRVLSSPHSCLNKMSQTQVDHLTKEWNKLLEFLDKSAEIKSNRQSWRSNLTFWKKRSSSTERNTHDLSEEDLDLQFDLTNHLSLERFEQLARESKSDTDFIEKILLAPCLNSAQYANLKRKENETLFTLLLKQRSLTNIPKLFHVFQEAAHYKHSVQLNICEQELFKKLNGIGTSFIRSEECPPGHAIVANGVKWNSKHNQCEVHIKNSWGSETNFRSNWYPMEPILSTTIEANYFGSK